MRLTLLTVILLGSFFAAPAHATLLVYEGFDYTAGNLHGKGGGSNIGFAGNWTDLSGPSQISGTQVTGANLPTLNNVVSQNTMSLRATGTTDPQVYRTLDASYGAGNTDGWIGFMLRKDSNGPFNNTDFAVLSFGNLFVGAASNGTYSIEDAAGSPAANGSAVQPLGQTVLVLVSIDFKAGSPDDVSLYISTGGALPGSPVATKTFNVGTTIDEVGFLFGWNAGWTVDELRIGTTMLDVVPEPSSLGLVAFGALGLLRRRRA